MDLNNTLSTIIGSAAPTPSVLNPMTPTIAFDPSNFNVPDLNSYMQSAYQALAPYYTQILQQAQGDYNTAMTMLNNQKSLSDYQANAESALSNYQLNQNTQAALQTLGLQFPQETNQLLDALNKRGIATTQQQPNQATSPLDVGKGGESGYEMSALTSDQQLRQEAVNRSAQQQQQNSALTLQEKQQSAAQSLQSGTVAQQQSLRNTQQGAEQGIESGTLSLAGQSAQSAIAKQQLQQQAQSNANQFGGSSGGFTGSNVLASKLPSQLASGSGNVSYNGQTYNVSSNPNGTKNVSIV